MEVIVIGNIINFAMDMRTELWQYLFVKLWLRGWVFNTLATAAGGEMCVLDYRVHSSKLVSRLESLVPGQSYYFTIVNEVTLVVMTPIEPYPIMRKSCWLRSAFIWYTIWMYHINRKKNPGKSAPLKLLYYVFYIFQFALYTIFVSQNGAFKSWCLNYRLMRIVYNDVQNSYQCITDYGLLWYHKLRLF